MPQSNSRKNPISHVCWPADVLKWIGFVLICLGTFSTAFIQRAVISPLSSDSLSVVLEAEGSSRGWGIAALVMTFLSCGAVPIYARLFVDGWRHTSSRKRYLLRLGITALISEFAYDWACSGTLLDMDRQNPMWALLVAAVVLSIFEQFEGKGVAAVLMKVSAVIASMLWIVLLQSDMGILTVLLVACFGLLENHRVWREICGSGLCLIQYGMYGAVLGMVPVHFYNGTRGKCPGWLFYLLYPAQLLVFGGAAALLCNLTR